MPIDATEETFERDVIQRSFEQPVVVDFWAEWCGPCRSLGPVIEKAVEARSGQVDLVKVDTDANPRLSQAFGIQSIPAVKAFKDGKVVDEFIGALPRDLIESATIDGAGPLAVFTRLIVPLAIPAIASLLIFQFLWVWNDLLVALIYVGGRPAVAPMTVTVSNLVNSLGQNWQLLTAAAFISMTLPLAVFFALQRYFVRGILAGAIKG